MNSFAIPNLVEITTNSSMINEARWLHNETSLFFIQISQQTDLYKLEINQDIF